MTLHQKFILHTAVQLSAKRTRRWYVGYHKCSELGCGFHLPEQYPLDKCPWHLTPDSDVKTKVAVAGGTLCLLGAGYGLSKVLSVLKSRKKQQEISQAQQEWRAKSESRNKSGRDSHPNDDREGNPSVRAGGEEST